MTFPPKGFVVPIIYITLSPLPAGFVVPMLDTVEREAHGLNRLAALARGQVGGGGGLHWRG